MKNKLLILFFGVVTLGGVGYYFLSVPQLSITNIDNLNKTVSFQLVSKLKIILQGTFKYASTPIGVSNTEYSVEQINIQGTKPGIQLNAMKNGKIILQQNVYFQ
jgi:hypothetical protein